MALLHALLNTVLPVFILAGLGWMARRLLKIEVKDPARLTMYVLTPGLIMNAILTSRMGGSEVGKVLGFALLLCGAMILITLLLSRLLGWNQVESSAAVLSTAFMNAANYGLPVVLLAFGQEGFNRAAVYVVPSSLLMYSVAVFYAARGRLDWRGAVAAIFKLPLVWASAVALAVRLLGIPVPDPVLKPIGMLANAAFVVAILLLGMQVAQIRLRGAGLKISIATVLRLVISPLVAMLFVAWLRPDPLTGKVLVLEAAMPASVNTMLFAVEFGAEPDQVSGAVMATTVLSMLTVTFWVWFLQR
ncbi:MAG: transporter [Firmicutes bacterium]|nr:transporter [Bacillota bacterium]